MVDNHFIIDNYFISFYILAIELLKVKKYLRT